MCGNEVQKAIQIATKLIHMKFRRTCMYMLSQMLRPHTLSLDYETLMCKCVHKTKDLLQVS